MFELTIGPLTNWGRWGEEDERGTLNLIDTAAVRRGFAAARSGRLIPLGHVIGSSRSPVLEGRRAAIHHHMLRDGGDPDYSHSADDFIYAEDYFAMPVHSASTHIDAISHGWRQGRMYNGIESTAVNSRGASRCGVEKMGPIVTRAIFIDMPRHLGVETLPDDFAIQPEHLDAALIDLPKPEPGDGILIRTGARDRPDLQLKHPGLDVSTARWLFERDISLVGGDTLAVEVAPSPTGAFSPLHALLIRDLGMPIIELMSLELLAAERCTECCLVVAPLAILGGTGSPVNPIAII